jgi:hypothetical protein
MRQMQNNFRRSIAMNQALETAKQPSSKIVKTKPIIEPPVAEQPQPIVESKPEPIVEQPKVEQQPTIEQQPKVEEFKPKQQQQQNRLPNLGK